MCQKHCSHNVAKNKTLNSAKQKAENWTSLHDQYKTLVAKAAHAELTESEGKELVYLEWIINS
jgi:hypothetical protein